MLLGIEILPEPQRWPIGVYESRPSRSGTSPQVRAESQKVLQSWTFEDQDLRTIYAIYEIRRCRRYRAIELIESDDAATAFHRFADFGKSDKQWQQADV